MGLRDQYSVSCDVERLVLVGNKEDYTTLATIIGHVQPSSGEQIALTDGDFSKSFTIYFDVGADVEIGDRMTINGRLYYLKELKLYNIGTLQHKECVMEFKNAT